MKRFITIFLILITSIFLVTPAHAELRDMWATVYKWEGKMNGNGTKVLVPVTSGITFQVLQRNSDTAETLYYYNNDANTSLTNPVSTTNFGSATVCDDKVAFRVDPGETNDIYVDLIVVDTAGGYTAFVEDFDENTHTIVINEEPNTLHTCVIWFSASDNAETDTGIDFDYDTKILDVQVEVVTVDATETIDIGLLSTETNGDADGLRDGVSVATAGIPTDTAVITGGSNIDYTPVTTYGALLVTAITGSDAVATNGGKSWIGHNIVSANAKSLTYTGSAGSDTAAGYILVNFLRTR